MSVSSELSRSSSVESILSIQSKETVFIKDTSDTDISSCQSKSFHTITLPCQNDQISDYAGAESTNISDSDSDIDFHYFPNCAQCGELNSNTFYSYCKICFNMRKKLQSKSNRKRKCDNSSSNEESGSWRSQNKYHQVDPDIERSSNNQDSDVQYLVTGSFFLI